MNKKCFIPLILFIAFLSVPILAQDLDWGDAPDGPYRTLGASNGPNHIIVPGMYLGSRVDAEQDGLPGPLALNDDNTGLLDDEDGVIFTNLIVAGNTVNVKVIASMPGFLDGWIDFNANGSWANAGEQVFAAQPLNPGINMLAITIPNGAAIGHTFARFRYSSVGGLSWQDPAPDGEVEDYRILIQEPLDNIKWEQPPDLDNTGMDVDFFYYMTPDIDALADDFLCTMTGPITDIHFWGSFESDAVPQLPSQAFEITIYSDVPAGVAAPWSMPGDILWRYYFSPGDYAVTLVAEQNPEDYYYPGDEFWYNDDHFQCFQYDFFIPAESAFIQQEGTIYWLGIRDLSWDNNYRFGWKTTTIDARWNDDAAFLIDPPAFWQEIRYPFGHEFEEQSLDLAFALSTEFQEELDWGDAPDGPYPTLAANNGANHLINPIMFLGSAIDPEPDGQPTGTALGDDNNGVPDDEDGVVITSVVTLGSTANVKVTASMPGFLDAWVDWNADGDWADAGENVFAGQALAMGVNNLTLTVPAGAAVGTTFSRWRYSSVGGLPFDGPAPDGEVEDCRVFVQRPLLNIKWEQPPDLDNTGMDVDFFAYEDPAIDALADDFFCTQTGPITDIHFWASFLDDVVPPLPFQTFEVTIYADIQAGQVADWSMPGEVLWRYIIQPGDYQVTQITDNNPEDYFFPPQMLWLDDNHVNCYQYDFFIPVEDAFVQTEGTIYWLGIRDLTYDGTYRFGWKTCIYDARWNDDATWLCDAPAYWCEMRYPPGHEYIEESLDLAFAISTEACDCEPGNCNGDGTINILDVTYLINYLYKGGPAPIPYALCSGDPNCDCIVNILDVTYLINFLYKGGPPPCSCQDWLAACGPPLRK